MKISDGWRNALIFLGLVCVMDSVWLLVNVPISEIWARASEPLFAATLAILVATWVFLLVSLVVVIALIVGLIFKR